MAVSEPKRPQRPQRDRGGGQCARLLGPAALQSRIVLGGTLTRRQLAALALAVAPSPAAGQSPFGSMLWDFLREYLRVLDDRRAARLAALESAEDFAQLRQRVRAQLVRMWGPFPPRTDLNPRQVGILDRGGHLVEKVIFESRAEFHVTANLYRPAEAEGPLPAVLVCCGHHEDGKAAESYQRFAILLARHGFVVLVWDPLGQGERLQFFDPGEGRSRIGGPTSEHRVLGNQCYLLGDNLMQYRAWDVTRALDYLEMRPEADAGRIGLAGQSGGGMTTLQFACCDDRIQAAFPSCAVASFRAKTEALLIADPEQILYGTLRAGVDHPELLAAFAPRPLLIGAALRDYVPIDGARRTHAELQGVYDRLGVPGQLHFAVTDAGHGLNRELREAGAAFFLRMLAGREEEDVQEGAEEILTAAELACTATGQVSTALRSRRVAGFNAERADAIAPELPRFRTASEFEVYRSEVANRVRNVTRVGAYKSEYGVDVPSRFLDAGVYAKGAVFLVADRGKDHPAVRRYCMDAIVAANHSVYGLDLRGWGATAAALPELEVRFEWDDFFAYRSLELGRPLLGQRLKDLLATAPQLTRRREWLVAGIGVGGLVAAHAAALDLRISGVMSIDAPLSFRAVLDDPHATQPVSSILPGVLGAYEIRDLYASIAPRPLLIVNARDAQRRPVGAAEARSGYRRVAEAYEILEAAEALRVESGLGLGDLRSLIGDWLRSVSA